MWSIISPNSAMPTLIAPHEYGLWLAGDMREVGIAASGAVGPRQTCIARKPNSPVQPGSRANISVAAARRIRALS
ncbi:hypothetical protein CVO77_16710 [Sphingopyxis lindanitolerans]|uniref:Uncharacterized protein n=1 Tax=Sphingopyxis lindanitolerans TaxID=2054227 RepID=A0A2S8B2W6_9SPHN|nr:hypothetical protein CVO77_16710 [Sphingopyxis lindanitolerans]